MGFNYRWARGEDKARELATKASGCDEWQRSGHTAYCGDVTCLRYEYMLEGDTNYKDYWLCYTRTDKQPKNPDKWNSTIGYSVDLDTPKERLRNGLESIFR